MPHRSYHLILILAQVFLTTVLGDCESFGVDFQSGGSYFQNSLSTDPFTALQEFEGCQNDTAHNVIVDPNGDQSECSETPLTPDDVPQLVTCSQWPKDQLYTGDWSLLIISNNGDGQPIAFQRDFSLTVGPQQTVTAPGTTVTGGRAGTYTETPHPTSVVVTAGILQFTVYTISVTTTTITTAATASCSASTKSSIKDPIATLIPSVLGELNSVASSIIEAAKQTPAPAMRALKRALARGAVPDDKVRAAFVLERRAALKKLAKRAPDYPTVTYTPAPVYVQATVTGPVITSTSTKKVLFGLTTISRMATLTSTSTIQVTAVNGTSLC